MKRTLLAAAIATGLIGVAHAETTLYGSLRASVNYNDQYSTSAGRDDGNWDVSTQSSRFGIKGTEDLGNGLTAAYQYEFKVGTKEGGKEGLKTRLAWVGLVGNFGTVALGRQTLPYYNVVGYNDIFNAPFSYDGYYLLGAERMSNALAYVSPSFNGFQIQAAIVMSGDDYNENAVGYEDDIDAFNISAIYDNAGWFAGLTYLQIRNGEQRTRVDGVPYDQWAKVDKDDQKFWGATIGYKNEVFQLGLAGEYVVDAGRNIRGEEKDIYQANLAGEYYFGDHTFRAALAYVDNEVVDDDGWFGALGYQYNFSKRTRLWVEGAYYDGGDHGVFRSDNKPITGDGIDDYDGFTVSVGLRHDF